MNQNKLNLHVINAVIARVLFSACWNMVWCIKTNFLLEYLCSDCKNTVFLMFGHFVMHQNKFSFEVLYAMIGKILFSTCWNIMLYIKTNFRLKYCMQWLQEYCYPQVWTFSDESKRIKFGGGKCRIHILFWSDEYSNIAGLLFSTWWNIVWCNKMSFL